MNIFRLVKDLIWVYRYQGYAYRKMIKLLGSWDEVEDNREKIVKMVVLMQTERGLQNVFANIANPWRFYCEFKYKNRPEFDKDKLYLVKTLGKHLVLLRLTWWIEDNYAYWNRIQSTKI